MRHKILTYKLQKAFIAAIFLLIYHPIVGEPFFLDQSPSSDGVPSLEFTRKGFMEFTREGFISEFTREGFIEFMRQHFIKGSRLNPVHMLGHNAHQRTSDVLKEKARTLVSRLEESVGNRVQGQVKVMVTGLFSQEGELQSKFSALFSDYLVAALKESKKFTPAVQSRSLARIAQDRVRTRGFSRIVLDGGSELVDALIWEAEATLAGHYQVEGEKVRITCHLRQNDGLVIGTAAVEIEKVLLSSSVTILPENYTAIMAAYQDMVADEKAYNTGSLKICVLTDRGKRGAVYRTGDELVVYFTANRDCYLNLYYYNAAGQMFQIFPNKFDKDNYIKAHRLYEIPNEGRPFRFVVKPPLGQEILKAVAATSPLPEVRSRNLEGTAFRSIEGNPSEMMRSFRGIGVVGKKVERAEDTCLILTLR